MDNFHEHLVERKATGADIAKNIGIIILAVVLSFILLVAGLYFFPMNLFAAVALCYGAYLLSSGIAVEYEYTVTNNEIDIDKIIGKRKRKRLITADISLFEHFGKSADAPAISDDYTVVKASDNTGEGEYFADFKHSSFGNVRILFTPDEEMLKSVEPYLNGTLRAELKRMDFLSKRQ